MKSSLGVLSAVALSACVGAHGQKPLPQASAPLQTSPADLAFETASTELQAARYATAGELYRAFADRFPADPRVASARLQQAYAALNQLEQVRGLDEAQSILALLAPESADPVALRQLRGLILARAQALQAQAAVSELLARCEGQAGSLVDRERAQSRAEVLKLQLEIQRREQTLEQVKQRLLEIQQLAPDMVGPPAPAAPETPR